MSAGKVPRRLHWWAIGILSLAIAAVMTFREVARGAGKGGERKNHVQQEPERPSPAPDKLVIERQMQGQKDAAEEASPANAAGTRQPDSARQGDAAPAAAQTGSGLAVPGLPPDGLGRERESDERVLKATIASSPILVFDTSATLFKTARRGIQGEEQDEKLMDQLTRVAQQDSGLAPEDRKLLAAAAGQVPAKGGRAAADRLWVRETGDRLAAERGSPIREEVGLSPYTLFQGAIVPAVLVSRINSELAGEISARVTQDVYDGIRSKHLLIPKGSLIYGAYNSDVNVGQERVSAVFHRIVFPNGNGITLGAMPGTDAPGQRGIPGEVDNHFWKMFGSSFLVAGLAAAVDRKRRSEETTSLVIGGNAETIGSAGGRILVDISRRILDRNTEIPPTVTVAQGQRFNIIVTRDIVLQPYPGSNRASER